MDRQFKAIVVGIETYDDAQTWRTLVGVGETAERVARAFGAEPLSLPEGGRKAEAPRALKAAIDALPERATLLVHWIGHGVSADQHYLVCRDSPRPALLDGFEAFPSGELGRIIANSRAERVVVLLDTCFSGEGGGNVAQRYRDSLAKQLDREGWQRVVCVIAASHPLDKAAAGRFSRGMVDALESPDRHLKWTSGDAYIDPERLAIAVSEMLGDDNKAVHPRFEKSGFGQDIIPNPLFRPSSGSEDLETRRHLEEVFGQHAHFNLASRGIEAGEAGYFFTGRRQSQEEIIQWLNGRNSDLMIVTGPPGAGKSALIGRIVTLSVPEMRVRLYADGALNEGDSVPPDNSVDIAIHSKGKSVYQVATSLGRAINLNKEIIDQPSITEVLERIESTGGPLTIVIDALDESGEGQALRIANEIIRPLAAMPNVRVLVGTRRSLDGTLVPDGSDRHGRLREAFGPDADIRDLADDPETADDITEFVARRLRASKSRGSDAWIAEVGGKVAAAADGSFLYARLVSRSLEELPDTTLDQLPAGAAAAFAQDVACRFGDDQHRVADMLRALAFGLGRGLARAVWAPIASALSSEGLAFTDEDVVWMLRRVGSYIVETTVETDGIAQAVYRLIHQALAEHLQRDSAYAHLRIVETLTRDLEGEAWLSVNPYLRRHLLEHAVLADRAGMGESILHGIQLPLGQLKVNKRRAIEGDPAPYGELERVLRNPAVIAISVPAVVLAMRPYQLSTTARRALEIFRVAADRLVYSTPAERWSLLHFTALTQGDAALAAVLSPPRATAWSGVWSRTRPRASHLAIRTNGGEVYSVALGTLKGRALIVSGGADGKVRLWNAEEGTPFGAPMTGHERGVRSVAMATVSGRALIVSGSIDGSVRLWDAEDGTPVGTPMTAHGCPIDSVAIGNVGGRMLIVSRDLHGWVRLSNAEDGTSVGVLIEGYYYSPGSVALGAVNDRALIVTGGTEGTVQLWDAEDGTPVGSPMAGHGYPVTSIALGSFNGRALIVSGGRQGNVRLRGSEEGKVDELTLVGESGWWVRSVALGTVNGRALILSGSDEGTVQLWDVEDGTKVGAPMTGHDSGVWSVALGTINERVWIVSGGKDGMLRLWDVESDTKVEVPASHDHEVRSLAMGTVNGSAVIVSASRDAIRQWDAVDGTPVGVPITRHEKLESSVAVGTVNHRALIVSGSDDGTVRRWDAENGTPVGVPVIAHDFAVASVAIGAVDGRTMIVSGSYDGTVRRWDAEDGTPIGAPMPGHQREITCTALSTANGRALIASADRSGVVRLWDAEEGEPVGASMTDHDGWACSVALGTVNGRLLVVSAGSQGTVWMWDVENGNSAGVSIKSHDGCVHAVALGTVNGRSLIVAGGDDGTLRLWDAETRDKVLSVPLGQSIYSIILVGKGRIGVGTAAGVVMLQIQI